MAKIKHTEIRKKVDKQFNKKTRIMNYDYGPSKSKEISDTKPIRAAFIKKYNS